tara:strand:- start:688 stop:915 length:228 start_codon:yes stop_codon:yes gene_type:complete
MSRNGISNIDTQGKPASGICDWNDDMGIPYFHTNVFKYHGVSKEAGWAIIKEDRKKIDRAHHNNLLAPERRGCKP